MVMTSEETQIQILAHWPMSHAKRVTRDNRKNTEYHVFAAIRKLRTDKNCPAGSIFVCGPLHHYLLLKLPLPALNLPPPCPLPHPPQNTQTTDNPSLQNTISHGPQETSLCRRNLGTGSWLFFFLFGIGELGCLQKKQLFKQGTVLM